MIRVLLFLSFLAIAAQSASAQHAGCDPTSKTGNTACATQACPSPTAKPSPQPAACSACDPSECSTIIRLLCLVSQKLGLPCTVDCEPETVDCDPGQVCTSGNPCPDPKAKAEDCCSTDSCSDNCPPQAGKTVKCSS
jgi:hypothetical protein